MHTLEGITLSDRDGQLMAVCRPTAGAPEVDLPSLRALLDQSGFGSWALSSDALALLIQRWLIEQAEFEIKLGQREDGHVTVDLAHDGSCAWATLSAARGGQALRLEDVMQALASARVVFGIHHAALAQACATGVDARLVAALAQPPQRGEDTRFELLVVDTRDRTPKLDAQGLIDYHELGDIPIVQAGQALMRRHPATPGVDGCDVRGKPLHASPGLNEAFDLKLPGAGLDDDNPNLLRALYVGQPVHSRNGVAVEKVLYLKNVSMASGNVHFDGTVEVAGDVHPGMKVDVTGDIVIKGLVEGAQLNAGASIHVFGGAIAHARLKAGSSVLVRFAENSQIEAGTALVIESMALHSDLQAQNQILVGTTAGQRGRLVGGSARATMLVRAPWLGAAAGGLTQVHVGVNPAFELRCRELDKQIGQQHVEADKLQKLVQHLQTHGDPRGLLDKVRAAWKQALQGWSESLAEKAELDRQLALTQGARIECTAGVAGDLDISFGKVVRHLRNGSGAGAFLIDEVGRVVFSPPGGLPAEVL